MRKLPSALQDRVPLFAFVILLGLSMELQGNGDAALAGPTPQHRIWVNGVPAVQLREPDGRLHKTLVLDVGEERVDAIAVFTPRAV